MIKRSALLALATQALFAAAHATSGVTVESDEQLALRFAPVFLNEHVMNKDVSGKLVRDMQFYDDLDSVVYDVAQTSTHIYLSYQAMRGWSMDREAEAAAFGFVKSKHPVDSEDVWEIVRKNADGSLSLVLYGTNAHGRRLVYGVDMNETEQRSALKAAELIEKTEVLITKLNGNLAIRTGGSPRRDDHPLVASGAGSHAINRAGFLLASDGEMLDQDIYSYATPAALGLPSQKGFQSYEMQPVNDVLSDMTFSREALAMGAKNKGTNDDKVAPCKARTLTVEGRQITSPALPTHFDVIWYLNTFKHFDLLRDLRAQMADPTSTFAKIYPNTLSQPEADFYWTHEGPLGSKLTECPRLDPAEAFERLFPATFKAQGGSREYTRYDLMNAKVKAYEGVINPFDL